MKDVEIKSFQDRIKKIDEEIKKLSEEKENNLKLKGTKFELEGISLNEEIEKIQKEKRKEQESIIKEFERKLDGEILEISDEFGVSLEKKEACSLEVVTKKALENIKKFYFSSEKFREILKGACYYYSLDLWHSGSEFPFMFSLIFEEDVLSLGLTGYAPTNVDFNNFDERGVLSILSIIRILEGEEAIPFILKKIRREYRSKIPRY
ncbi:hypothetical protein C4565_02380 [Candidatus Parcubacteria bacterium]|jgi:hypothetical protein|nr:MAG: hypothetical protein C4565_02380 [Candidatus Parcubacteria bacterium]